MKKVLCMRLWSPPTVWNITSIVAFSSGLLLWMICLRYNRGCCRTLNYIQNTFHAENLVVWLKKRIFAEERKNGISGNRMSDCAWFSGGILYGCEYVWKCMWLLLFGWFWNKFKYRHYIPIDLHNSSIVHEPLWRMPAICFHRPGFLVCAPVLRFFI